MVSWPRLGRPSLAGMFWTRVLTVDSAKTSVAAISALDRPRRPGRADVPPRVQARPLGSPGKRAWPVPYVVPSAAAALVTVSLPDRPS